MNFRTTLFLLVLVLIVGTTLFFKTRHDDDTKKPDKTEERRLVDFDSGDVTKVAITNSDDKHLVLQKTGSDWKMVEPVAARAKSFEVDDLIRALVGLKSRSQLDESKKTSGGLDHPSVVVELTTKSKTTKLSFGENSSVGDSLYVLVDDAAKPDIISNSIYASLDKPASNYRDMRLINTPSGDIKQLAITQKGKTIRLEKTGENWEITEPVKIPAETSAVGDLLSGITNIDATEFVDTPSAAAKTSVAHPKVSVVFSTATATTQPAATQGSEVSLNGGETLKLGAYQDVTKKNVFASLNGKEIAVIPASTLETFDKTPLDLRNRDVVTVTADRVSSFTVSINKPATTQPTTQPAEMREFTIERHKAEAPVLGPALPGDLKIPAPATQPSAIPATQPAVATTQPSPLTTQPAVATTEPTTQAAEIAAAKWIFRSGGTGAAEEGQVTDLLADLHPLRAEKYLDSDKVPGATYTLTLHVIPATAADSSEDIILTVIDTGGRVDGFYKDLHFTVNRSLIDKLTGDFKTKKAAPPAMAPPSFPGGGGSPFGG